MLVSCFFFNDTATTEIYTLSLHDALPISYPGPMGIQYSVKVGRPVRSPLDQRGGVAGLEDVDALVIGEEQLAGVKSRDRKSTRLNSSHANISYAVFCLKKKKNNYHSFSDL